MKNASLRARLLYLFAHALMGEVRCFCCGKASELKGMNLEHVIPRSSGGSNRQDNLALSHKRCNSARGSSFALDVLKGNWYWEALRAEMLRLGIRYPIHDTLVEKLIAGRKHMREKDVARIEIPEDFWRQSSYDKATIFE